MALTTEFAEVLEYVRRDMAKRSEEDKACGRRIVQESRQRMVPIITDYGVRKGDITVMEYADGSIGSGCTYTFPYSVRTVNIHDGRTYKVGTVHRPLKEEEEEIVSLASDFDDARYRKYWDVFQQEFDFRRFSFDCFGDSDRSVVEMILYIAALPLEKAIALEDAHRYDNSENHVIKRPIFNMIEDYIPQRV